MAKGEMLLERLPYMGTLRRHNKLRGLQDLGKELDKVTRMTGIGSAATVDGDDEGEDADGNADGVEQWSTDRPTEDASTSRKKLFGIREKSIKAETVKDKMQSLVLEDDDIVDDE
jgi:cell cycle checkpoint protein